MISWIYDKSKTKSSICTRPDEQMNSNMHKIYHILIIDDEDAIRDMVQFSLKRYQFNVTGVADCTAAAQYLQQQTPDLILLDWMLPDKSGIEFAQHIRTESRLRHIPIVMLTAKAEEANKLRGFNEAEVDDYITKPFSPKELAARLRAVLRRVPPQQTVKRVNNLELDYQQRKLFVGEQEITMTAKQFNLLHLLMENVNKVYTRRQIVERLSQYDYIDERSIDRQVKRLRDTLKPYDYHNHIKTIRGHGYKMVDKA